MEGNVVQIRVSDTGPGLATEAGPEGEARPGANPAGHGLGIAVCRKVVQGVGGKLLLETPPWGWGTCLRAQIPLDRVSTGQGPG